jgi:Ca2+-binding RTX toxin-like protein
VFSGVTLASNGTDTIAFVGVGAGGDTLQFSVAAVNTATGSTLIAGTLSADNFFSGSDLSSVGSDDYFLYDTDDGSLWFDADGSGIGAAVQLATLTGAPAIDNTDIVLA